ncbi:MAG: DUF3108 domain-containing protein [Proteobacteria bacterium]|uniref:DUF3108 domain-containing protein n=1 Tax=Rudaea sp. TaxID=2136325 RepID=UPI0032209D45|nr:DUF3108 domain-containing protein [Pseudomonadota bacterium]
MNRSALFLALAVAAFAAHGADLKPMGAVYTVTRDGSAIGDSNFSLKHNPDGTWTLTSETRGTSGKARLLGIDVREEAVFRWNNGKPQSLVYDYRQSSLIKSRTRHIEFDAAAQQAHSQENKDRFTYATPPGTTDRGTLQLLLAAAAVDGEREISVPVAIRDRVEQQHYAVTKNETIRVPAGSFSATRVERTDNPGKAINWYAPNAGVLPVKVQQISGDGSTVVLELKQRNL